MDLQCTNPNYMMYHKPSKKVTFISREHYLSSTFNMVFDYYKTRCNKCLACRLFKGYEWSNRLLAESHEWEYTYFLTLTFNEEKYDINTLLNDPMRESQLFMKRLRKKFKDIKLKHFTTSELGGETLRFHYHMILYSEEHIFSDMIYKKNQLYSSPLLNKLWSNGNCMIAWATHDTMRYVSNYVQDTKNSVRHCFSQRLGIKYMLRNDREKNGIYTISGNYSKIPKSVKLNNNYDDTYKFLDIDKLIHIEKISDHENFEKNNKIRERYIENGFNRKAT